MKSVAELIEESREKEIELIKAYIRSKGGDGLVSPDCGCGCGCGIDYLFECGEDPEDCDGCYPAKSGKGEWEGMPGIWYHLIEENEVPE